MKNKEEVRELLDDAKQERDQLEFDAVVHGITFKSEDRAKISGYIDGLRKVLNDQ